MLRVLILLFTMAVAGVSVRSESAEAGWGVGTASGTLSEAGEFPAAGALLSLEAWTEKIGNFNCSGTLIAPRAFLTATHCVLFNNSAELIEPWNIKPASILRVYFQTAGIYNVKNVLVSPDWQNDYYFLRGDIAILELDRPVLGVRPMAINIQSPPYVGMDGVIVGFGALKMIGNCGGPECHLLKMGIKRQGYVKTSICPPESQGKGWFVCFGGPSAWPSQAQICKGDSGGGLYTRDATAIVGVTSTIVPAPRCSSPHQVDIDLFSHRPWIEAQLAMIASASNSASELCGGFACLSDNDVRGEIDYLIHDAPRTSNSRYFSFDVPAGVKKLVITLNGQAQDDESLIGNARFTLSVPSCGPYYKQVGQFESCEYDNPPPGPFPVTVTTDEGSGLFQITGSYLRSQRPQDLSPTEPSESDEDPYDLWDSDKASLERGK